MKDLLTILNEMSKDFGFNKPNSFRLNESNDIEQKVYARLNKTQTLDEVETVSFGLETDDGKIVKVFVASKDADKFEDIMAKALGEIDDIEAAINKAAKDVEIVDVEWPEEKVDHSKDNPDQDVKDDGSEVLDPDVFKKANINKEMDDIVKPKLEHTFLQRLSSEPVFESHDDDMDAPLSRRLSTGNQQLIFQALLELGIPERALERSQYKVDIIRNIRRLATDMNHNASMKNALKTFVKRTIDFNQPEEAMESFHSLAKFIKEDETEDDPVKAEKKPKEVAPEPTPDPVKKKVKKEAPAEETPVNNVEVEEDPITIKKTKQGGFKLSDGERDFEFVEENLEQIIKTIPNKKTVSVESTDGTKFIVAAYNKNTVFKIVGETTKIVVDAKKTRDLMKLFGGVVSKDEPTNKQEEE
jgi:hypothetical protein